MAISQYGNEYYGLSGDDKPLGTPLNGRKFTEMDTSKEYRFDAENQQWLQQAGGGGGGGSGSSTLSGLTDVDISNPTDGQTLVYNSTSGKWENGAGGGVLVVGVNDQTMTLDKTWSELHAADFAVLITNDGSERSHYILGGTFVEEGSSTYYNAEFFSIYTLDGAAETNTLLFRASSANDYPAFYNPA